MLVVTALLAKPRASAQAIVLLVDTQRLRRLRDQPRQTVLNVMLAVSIQRSAAIVALTAWLGSTKRWLHKTLTH
eukprot:COSAG04_NODE_19892_length_406_cov_0.381107_2_plen_73_part_01